MELLVGRKDEAVDFFTALEADSQGIYVLSGTPGVGKTSFFNIQQYRSETGEAPFGPNLLAARDLCSVYPNDSPRDIALRVVHSVFKSIEAYCSINGISMPDQAEEIGKWANREGASGFDIGLTIAGFGGSFGREVEVPPVSECTFEMLEDVLACLAGEVVSELDLDGMFVALDNVENLEDQVLNDLLITFRDTLFMTSNVRWVLIGQSGLSSLLQSLDTRISDLIQGTGLELQPIMLTELNEAIERRVKKFSDSEEGQAPLPNTIHEILYNASSSEIRFVFKYSNAICEAFVSGMRKAVLEEFDNPESDTIDEAIGDAMSRGIIPEDVAKDLLKRLAKEEIEGFGLTSKEKDVLKKLHELGSARPKQANEFGLKTQQDFSSNYLTKMHRQNLLARRQEGRAVYYSLRGISAVAAEFDLLD